MSNIATKLTTIADNQQRVYDAGYLKGKAETAVTSWADLGEGIVTTVLADNQVFSTAEHDGEVAILPFLLKQGATYDVVCQGVSYTGLPVKSVEVDGFVIPYIGNIAVGIPESDDTGENFMLISEDTASALKPKEPAENITLSVTEHAQGVLPLPQKYAPEIKRFYWNRVGGDLPQWHGYLYLDKECTIKASKADLVECRTAFCLVWEADERLSHGTIHFPLYVYYDEEYYPYAACVIRYVDTDYTFVTGECVPE